MKENIKLEITNFLLENKEEAYAVFSSKLLPNIESSTVLGVRIPKLRKLVKSLSKKYDLDSISSYIQETHYYFEETMLAGFLLASFSDWNVVVSLLDGFVGKIDNWSVCDSFCSSLKITKKYKAEMLDFITKYIDCENEFKFRFACVMLLNYYLEEKYLEFVTQLMKQRKVEGYYAKMAVAWLYCSIYPINKRVALDCVLNEEDALIQEKTISKMIDSFVVDVSDKEYLRNLRKSKNRL